MDLSTRYLGFDLPHPLVVGASPLVDDLGMVRWLEDAGAAAIVMHSLFEEQIARDQTAAFGAYEEHAEGYAEATSYFPRQDIFALGPEEYLEQIRRIKEAVKLPVIASLNGATPAGWLRYARLMEQAGADALELNIYSIATDPKEDGAAVDARTLEIVRTARRAVTIPIAVKLSPFYSSVAWLAAEIDEIGAEGLVLFNRFYQPDIDVEALGLVPALRLSDSSELLLRLRWIAILSGRIGASLAASGGVHTALDAVKAVMAGAHAVQVVSSVLKNGPDHLRTLRAGITRWLEEHEYESLRQMQGSMSLDRCPDPAALERGNYMRVLQSWRK
jgi:dihydroorotate dehydrogenase (fumarate)